MPFQLLQLDQEAENYQLAKNYSSDNSGSEKILFHSPSLPLHTPPGNRLIDIRSHFSPPSASIY